MKKIYSLLMALCMVFSATANVFEMPVKLESSNKIAATRVAKKVNVESMKKAVTTMQVKESFKTAQVKIDATSKTAAKAAAATTGLQYDATSGEVNRTYSTKEVSIETGNGFFTITGAAADGSDEVDVVLFANKDANTLIPVGTYTFASHQRLFGKCISRLCSAHGLTNNGYGFILQNNIEIMDYLVLMGVSREITQIQYVFDADFFSCFFCNRFAVFDKDFRSAASDNTVSHYCNFCHLTHFLLY